jgi:hypothetical protein
VSDEPESDDKSRCDEDGDDSTVAGVRVSTRVRETLGRKVKGRKEGKVEVVVMWHEAIERGGLRTASPYVPTTG